MSRGLQSSRLSKGSYSLHLLLLLLLGGQPVRCFCSSAAAQSISFLSTAPSGRAATAVAAVAAISSPLWGVAPILGSSDHSSNSSNSSSSSTRPAGSIRPHWGPAKRMSARFQAFFTSRWLRPLRQTAAALTAAAGSKRTSFSLSAAGCTSAEESGRAAAAAAATAAAATAAAAAGGVDCTAVPSGSPGEEGFAVHFKKKNNSFCSPLHDIPLLVGVGDPRSAVSSAAAVAAAAAAAEAAEAAAAGPAAAAAAAAAAPLVRFVSEIPCGDSSKYEIVLRESWNPIRQDRHKDVVSFLSAAALLLLCCPSLPISLSAAAAAPFQARQRNSSNTAATRQQQLRSSSNSATAAAATQQQRRSSNAATAAQQQQQQQQQQQIRGNLCCAALRLPPQPPLASAGLLRGAAADVGGPLGVIGALALIDSGCMDYKILVVSSLSPLFGALNSPQDLELLRPGFLDSLKFWFSNYKLNTPGGPSKPNTFDYGGAPLGSPQAWRIIEHAHQSYLRLLANPEIDPTIWLPPQQQP
ncbi:soluble inorganic pyrophosphatase, putative [Eimeria tenella]|uniref:inorganic diphosphatase n=1 Tax=Eimeria tenella TaxID=5802 RepID=U6KNV9_EIMTE|nr:soluble inorganic pyrophosphatase, putative [Eimeria tenella]CDJ37143.1 soluble inorganic pyrophosphatase, putative [Eimeria tenella]|eukprot:XP_013227981.1 soluble inorganic pyrophosphatase, putative [Eimeria tenella]